METVRLGTRGSALALAQAEMTKRQILEKRPRTRVEICVIRTQGDKDHVRSLVSFGGQGVFVKEIEEALLKGEVDMAVHSLKDVPDSMDARLELSGFLRREDPRDVLVSKKTLSELSPNATVGTGSPRRVLQLKALRPDLNFVNLRGNLPSRIEKVNSGELDAIVLGAAGLVRLNRAAVIAERFDVEKVTPAIGQGIVALETLKDRADAAELSREISDPNATVAALVEREWMGILGGGCRAPMGAILEPAADGFRFTAFLADVRNGNSLRMNRTFCAADLQDSLLRKKSLSDFAEIFIGCAREKKIPLPLDISNAEDFAAFWNRP